MARTRRRVLEHQINVDLPVDLYDGLQDFCESRNVKRKQVIELALRKFLLDEKAAGNAGDRGV